MRKSKNWPNNPFWDFSLEYYDREGVAERLLLLQENLMLDVNLVLYCCWAGYIGAPILTESEVRFVESVVKSWQNEIVKPLRGLRSKVKYDSKVGQNIWEGKVYSQIKKAELEAERLEQLTIYQIRKLKPDDNLSIQEKRNRARSNIVLYLRCLRREPNSEEIMLIDNLMEQLCH